MNILLRQVASCRNILRPNNYGPPCVIDINTAMLRVYGGAVRNSIKMAVSNFFISFLNLLSYAYIVSINISRDISSYHKSNDRWAPNVQAVKLGYH